MSPAMVNHVAEFQKRLDAVAAIEFGDLLAINDGLNRFKILPIFNLLSLKCVKFIWNDNLSLTIA